MLQFVNAAMTRKLSSIAKLTDCRKKVDDKTEEIVVTVGGESERSWWAGIIHELRYDSSFWITLSANIDQGEAAYARYRGSSSL